MKLALFADIHSNLEALTACLEHAARLGAERHAFLGDLVGYGADPVAVLDLIAEHAGRETAEVYGPPARLAEVRAQATAQGLNVRPAGPAIAIVGSEKATNGVVPPEAIRRAASLEDVFVLLTGEEAE